MQSTGLKEKLSYPWSYGWGRLGDKTISPTFFIVPDIQNCFGQAEALLNLGFMR